MVYGNTTGRLQCRRLFFRNFREHADVAENASLAASACVVFILVCCRIVVYDGNFRYDAVGNIGYEFREAFLVLFRQNCMCSEK